VNSRKPPPVPTQEPDDLLADTLVPDDSPAEDGLVPPAIADDPEHDRLIDPEEEP
jgi:hypothetical protein